MASPSEKIKKVKNWAAKYDLTEELKVLLDNGFVNLQSLALLTESDLDTMGFTKIGTKKKIMAAVSEINCKIAKLREMGGSLAQLHNIAYADETEITTTTAETTTETMPIREPTGDEILEYFEIRKAIFEDIPKIRDIFNFYCKTNPEITGEEHEKPDSHFVELFQLQDEKHPILVQALTKPLFGFPVGCIISYCFIHKFISRSGFDSIAEVSLYLHPEFKSKGLGTALVLVSTKFCIDNGIEKLVTQVNATNIASIKMQEKIGMTKIGVYPEMCVINGKKVDTYIYQKDILKDIKDLEAINRVIPLIHQNVVKSNS